MVRVKAGTAKRPRPGIYVRTLGDGSKVYDAMVSIGGGRQEWRTFPTIAEAEDWRDRTKPKVRDGRHVRRERVTVAEYLNSWLDGRLGIRHSTRVSQAQHIRTYLAPLLGDVKLQQLRPEAIERAYGTLVGQLSPASIRRIHSTLHKALKDGVTKGKLTWNPASNVELPEVPHHEIKPWEPAELKAFLAHTADDPLAALWRMLALMGMRRGEALGLKWSDVDLDWAELTIRRTLLEVSGHVMEGSPKTKGSRRPQALDRGTVAMLIAHRERQQADRQAWGDAWVDEGWVFCRANGDRLRPDYVSKRFRAIVRQVGLPPARLHDLRHGAATNALALSFSVHEVAKMLGHSTPQLVLQTYGHVLKERERQLADKMGSRFDAKLDAPLDDEAIELRMERVGAP